MSDPTATLRPLARRMVLRALLIAGTTLVMVAAAGRPVRAAGTVTISIDNFAFAPAELSVAPGTTVVWTNHDDVEHTVTASDNGFTSTAIQTAGQFSYTFSTPGTYSYFCAIHPFMTAKVIVQ